MRQIIKKARTLGASKALQGALEEEVRPALDHGAQAIPATPGVRLVHVDGRVQAVEVTCRCGDVAVLDIEYDQ